MAFPRNLNNYCEFLDLHVLFKAARYVVKSIGVSLRTDTPQAFVTLVFFHEPNKLNCTQLNLRYCLEMPHKVTKCT